MKKTVPAKNDNPEKKIKEKEERREQLHNVCILIAFILGMLAAVIPTIEPETTITQMIGFCTMALTFAILAVATKK